MPVFQTGRRGFDPRRVLWDHFAPVVQRREHRSSKAGVGGSIPSGGTDRIRLARWVVMDLAEGNPQTCRILFFGFIYYLLS